VVVYENRYGNVAYAEGMHLSVNCAEELTFSDTDESVDADSYRVPPILWEYLRNDASGLSFGCTVWDVDRQPRTENERVQSTVPTLLIGGAFDPITPVDWMMSARAGLPNSQLAVFTYGGHGVSLDSPCGIGLVTAHFNAPTLQHDLSCAAGEIDFYDG
jgi:pimeloyl-ACP methyl ester carboxylesterase